jgi:hypothetical protein
VYSVQRQTQIEEGGRGDEKSFHYEMKSNQKVSHPKKMLLTFLL